MTEAYRLSQDVTGDQLLDVYQTVQALKKEFFSQSQSPPGGDEVIGAMSNALHRQSVVNPRFRSLLQEIIIFRGAQRKDFVPSELAGIIRSSLMFDQESLGTKPEYQTDPDWWEQVAAESAKIVLEEPLPADYERHERLANALMFNPVMTSVPSRAIPDELTMQIMARRYPDGIRWLDIGSGIGEVISQVFLKDRYPLDQVSIFRSLGTGAVRKWQADDCLTAKANQLSQRPAVATSCVGVDIMDPRHDPILHDWVFGSLRPKELKDPDFMAKFDYFSSVVLPQVTYIGADFTNPESLDEIRDALPGGEADFITMSTVQHQSDPPQRRAMDRHALQLAAPGALVLKKDFVKFAPGQSGPAKTGQFFRHWHKGSGLYRQYAIDTLDLGAGWQELWRARDSRCTELLVGRGRLLIDGDKYSVDELLAAA